MRYALASSSGSNDNPAAETAVYEKTGLVVGELAEQDTRMAADLDASHDNAGGMMKIVPSEVGVSQLTLNRFKH